MLGDVGSPAGTVELMTENDNVNDHVQVADSATKGVIAPDAADETTVEPPAAAWAEVPALARFDAAERDGVAQRLAAAWISDGADDDDALLAAVIDEVGFSGFVDLLRPVGGAAGRLAAVMDTSTLLRSPDRQLLEASKLNAAALERVADRIDDLTLDGDLDAAVSEASTLLVKVRSNLDRSRTSNPLVKLLRPNTSGLRFTVGDLLASLSQR